MHARPVAFACNKICTVSFMLVHFTVLKQTDVSLHVCCSEQCSMYDTEAGWVPLEGNTNAAEGGMCMG